MAPGIRVKVYIGTSYVKEYIDDHITWLTRVSESGHFNAVDGQLEKCPDTGRIHVQFKIWCKLKITIVGLHNMNLGFDSLTPVIGKDFNPDYAIKPESRVEGC